VFHAWWPSQFSIEDTGIKTLATYRHALPDSFSSDLNVGDVEANGGWKGLEKIYQINLDPKRLTGRPSVVEGEYGKGKAILSLIHFDTEGDADGPAVLRNLWKYMAGHKAHCGTREPRSDGYPVSLAVSLKPGARTVAPNMPLMCEIQALVTDLIRLGERNFLWFWRNPMLLQWRRGVRGLEYNTLYVMIEEISEILDGNAEHGIRNSDKDLEEIRGLLMPFVEKAKRLLILERCAMQSGHITYEKCNAPEIRNIRMELFSYSKSYGGMFKKLVDRVDNLLFSLLNKGRDIGL
jgi:hypothetical protein